MASIPYIDKNLNLLGTPEEEEAFDPTAVAGLGLGSGFVANQIAQNTAARQGFELVGQPRTTSTAGRLMGGTAPQYTGATPPPRITPGTQIVPTGQPLTTTTGTQVVPTSQSTALTKTGTSTNTPNYTVNRGPQTLGTSSLFSKLSSGMLKGTMGGPSLFLNPTQMGDSTLSGANRRAAERGEPIPFPDYDPHGFKKMFAELKAKEQPQDVTYTSELETDNTIALEPLVRYSDPIRSTVTMPDGTVIMEKESGERFTPTAEQLQSFTETMQQTSQPTATGLGVGGSEGVVFGGGQAPMGVEATRAALQERFGAPTISAIQALPEGQGLGMQVDPQGRMLTPGADRSAYEAASAAREARIAERDLRPGETQTERDTRIAQSRTQGATTGGLKMSDAVELAGGDRDLARTMVVRSRLGMDPMTGKKEEEPFEPRVIEMGGRKFAQLTPDYYQILPEEPEPEVPFEPRSIEVDGETLYEVSPNRFSFKPRTSRDDEGPLFPTDSNAGTTDISTIPDSAKEMLRKNPSLREFFDQKYGAGAAAQVLGE